MKAYPYSLITIILITLAFLVSGEVVAADIDATLPDSDNTSSFQVKNPESSNNILLKVQSGGNVGIGTTDPKEKLQIGDSLTIHDGGWKILNYNSYWWENPLVAGEGNDKRIVSGFAAAMAFTDIGDILFRTAGNGPMGGILDDGTYPTWDANTPPLIVKNDGKIGIGTNAPNSTLQVNGSFSVKRTGVSTNYLSAGETIIGITQVPTTGLTVTLASVDCVDGRMIYIKDESNDPSTGPNYPVITVNTQGNETIDGQDLVTISMGYGNVVVYSNGVNWFQMGASQY